MLKRVEMCTSQVMSVRNVMSVYYQNHDAESRPVILEDDPAGSDRKSFQRYAAATSRLHLFITAIIYRQKVLIWRLLPRHAQIFPANRGGACRLDIPRTALPTWVRDKLTEGRAAKPA